MRWFMMFALVAFASGLLLGRMERRQRMLLLFMLCLALTFVFFFLRRI